MKAFTLECCVDSVISAKAAQKGGATRLELCSNLIIGGTSPTPSLYKIVRQSVDLPIRVLLRPRFGDFCYTDDEILILEDEVRTFSELGADGIVIGCLNSDGTLDINAMKRLIDTAGNIPITLHRAFDLCKNPLNALKSAKQLGISTILTSGAKSSALDGMELLCTLVKESDGIEILAGAGINAKNLSVLCENTPLTSFHMSGKTVLNSPMQYRNPDVFMGLPSISEYELWQTDYKQIRSAREVLDKYFG